MRKQSKESTPPSLKSFWKDEDKLKEWLAEELSGSTIRSRSGQAKITDVIINYNSGEKPYPHRILGKTVYPDLIVFHSGLKLMWRKLSNPFYIETILNGKPEESINQMLPYKYKHATNIFNKYGDYHVVFTNTSLLNSGYVNDSHSEKWLYDFTITRVLWQLGFGVMRNPHTTARTCAFADIDSCSKFLIEFNEQEFIIVEEEIEW